MLNAVRGRSRGGGCSSCGLRGEPVGRHVALGGRADAGRRVRPRAWLWRGCGRVGQGLSRCPWCIHRAWLGAVAPPTIQLKRGRVVGGALTPGAPGTLAADAGGMWVVAFLWGGRGCSSMRGPACRCGRVGQGLSRLRVRAGRGGALLLPQDVASEAGRHVRLLDRGDQLLELVLRRLPRRLGAMAAELEPRRGVHY